MKRNMASRFDPLLMTSLAINRCGCEGHGISGQMLSPLLYVGS